MRYNLLPALKICNKSMNMHQSKNNIYTHTILVSIKEFQWFDIFMMGDGNPAKNDLIEFQKDSRKKPILKNLS